MSARAMVGRHMVFKRLAVLAAVSLVAGCDRAGPDHAVNSKAETGTQPIEHARAALDPNVFILKCTGQGSSAATFPRNDGFSDPSEEELYVKVDLRTKSLQTWIINEWLDWCSAKDKCDINITNGKVDLRLVSTEHSGHKTTHSTESFRFSRLDGRYVHVDDERIQENGNFTLGHKTTISGKCIKVDQPA